MGRARHPLPGEAGEAVRARITIAGRDCVLPTLDGPLAVQRGEVVVTVVVDDVASASDAIKALEAASSVRAKLQRGKR